MKQLIIFGAGKIAELAYFYFTHDSEYEVVAFVVDKAFLGSETFYNLPVVSTETVTKNFPPTHYDAFVALSYAQLNKLRAKKYLELRDLGYQMVSYISSKATIWPGFKCGENCFVLEDNTIQPFVTIGDNVILWSGNHIGHHSTIEDNVFISSHVVISGGVVVKTNSFIGVNASVRDHVTLEKNNIISAGATILKSTVENGVYVGSPATLSKVPSFRVRNI